MLNEGASSSIADDNNNGDEHLDDSDPDEYLEFAHFVGKQFSTDEDAKTFYNNFAYQRRFSIRKANHYVSSKLKMETMIKYVCSMQGLPKKSSHDKTPEKEKPTTRTGCKAHLTIRLVDGCWKVSAFEDVHNHQLISSPAKKRGLRSHRKLTFEDREFIREMNSQNIETAKIYELLGARYGGTKNLKFKRRDVSNVIASYNREFVGIDVESTLVYFQKKKEEDLEFFYDAEVDEDGRLKNIFWVDGKARRAFQDFGDVVTFDSTYQTNKYCMPLAPFIGVNHHRMNIYFGFAILRSEATISFIWLFQTWVKAMYGKKPKAIITDQDPAMRIAIKEVLPNTVHRCCQWHVMRNASEHLGAIYNMKEDFEDDLKRVINRSYSVSEFEEGWKDVLQKHGLRNNQHLNNMYAQRFEWVPTYFRDVFCANMSTSQRSESANVSLKIWINNHSSMYKVVLQVEKRVEGIWAQESDEDITTMKAVPKLSSLYLIEKDAYEVYTKKVMSEVKKRIKGSQLGEVNEVEKDALYEVAIKEHPTIKNWIPETYMVKINKLEELVSCSCKGYEFEGLLCSHAIKVMHHVKMFHLPNRYIMKRWCKDANACSKRSNIERSMEFGSTQEQEAIRYATLKPQVESLLKMASRSSDAFNQFQEILNAAKTQLQEVSGEQENRTPSAMTPSQGILDQPISQCKEKRKKPSRFKPPSEAKKPRKCGICGSKKGGHNRRTCPLRKVQGKAKKKAKDDDEDSEEEFEDVESDSAQEIEDVESDGAYDYED
ncbi:hypothetical protein LUZ63_006621 [Rhynchospora breviuscula]|uniref:SWIM-type domain-containing protein n=1 Tax=Rhynchospora breviuscula TaxID=2022672 RepID=A0A9Q0CQ38_9POAL|nr:hypothetical protein LUZ63_006621 [Rhynchospora breviuscula]